MEQTQFVERRDRLTSGAITWTWCSLHMTRTRHIYLPGTPKPLTCLECEPDKEPRKEPQQ
jgi:hypothetical protein